MSVNTGSRKQTIEGFGASMTAASAWVIWRHPAKVFNLSSCQDLEKSYCCPFFGLPGWYRDILLRFQNDIAQIYYSLVYLGGDCSKLLFTLLTSQDAILRDLFNPESGNGMSYVRIPVSLMSDFMARDGGGWKRF